MNGLPDKATPQSDAADVKIDRLALDIPGLDRGEAQALAQDLGERLAIAGVEGARPYIGLTIDSGGGSRADLAARIAAALIERLA
jgi:hypothetical protein